MASQSVIDSFKSVIAAVDPAVPIVEAAAVQNDNSELPDLFQVLVFTGADSRRTAIGPQPCFRETGNLTVLVYGVSGDGEALIRVHAEALSVVLAPYIDPAIHLFVNSCSPPENPTLESNGRWYPLAINITFDRDITK